MNSSVLTPPIRGGDKLRGGHGGVDNETEHTSLAIWGASGNEVDGGDIGGLIPPGEDLDTVTETAVTSDDS